MTALCLCNNISRHIKITSEVLNFEFVTENFVAISPVKIVFWFLNFAMEICNISDVLKKNVFFFFFCTDYVSRTTEQNYESNLIKYNVKFYTKPILSFPCFSVVS